MFLRDKINRVLGRFVDFFTVHCHRDFSFKLEEIDFKANKVIIRCIGLRTIIKTTLEEAVYDASLIRGMSPIEACMLGGYLGRYLKIPRENQQPISKKTNQFSFLLSNKTGRYCIAFQDRSGEVGYFDRETKKEFLRQPLEIVKDSHLISLFDPSQACYIGLLAGSSLEKAISVVKKSASTKPNLRIVK